MASLAGAVVYRYVRSTGETLRKVDASFAVLFAGVPFPGVSNDPIVGGLKPPTVLAIAVCVEFKLPCVITFFPASSAFELFFVVTFALAL